MASRLINSGELKNYEAIGEDGIPVWTRADAFRTSIENSPELGKKYADYLALPRFSTDGTHVDWFIPFSSARQDGEYDIVSWSAASAQERALALEELSGFSDKLYAYGMNLEARALNSNDRLFSHFLIGNGKDGIVNPAIHFPDENCVFLVNGRPVITFWGFLRRGFKLEGDPFVSLIRPQPKIVKETVSETVSETVKTVEVKESFFKKHKWCLLLPLLLLLLLLLLYLLWWWLYGRLSPLFGSVPNLLNGSLDPVPVTAPAPDNRDNLDNLEIKDPVSDDVEVTDSRELAVDEEGRDIGLGVDADHDSLNVNTDGSASLHVDGVSGTDIVADGSLTADGQLDDVAGADLDGVDGTADALNSAVDADNADGTENEADVDADNSGVNAQDNQNVPDMDTAADENAQDNQNVPDMDTAADENAQNNQNVPDMDTAADENAQNNQNVPDMDTASAKDNAQANQPLPDMQDQNDADNSAKPSVLSNDDLASGNIRGIDGNWNVKSSLVDSTTNRPIQMKYSFENGKGKATITRKNGVKCVADVNSQMASGGLSISSDQVAKCTDGTSYKMPDVTCKPGKNGVSRCVSSYKTQDGRIKQFPMVIQK